MGKVQKKEVTEIPISSEGDQAKVIVVKDDDQGGFNIYWLFFILGFFFTPLFCLIGSFGLCSNKVSERRAGKVNLIGFFLGLIIIAALIIAYLKIITDMVESLFTIDENDV